MTPPKYSFHSWITRIRLVRIGQKEMTKFSALS